MLLGQALLYDPRTVRVLNIESPLYRAILKCLRHPETSKLETTFGLGRLSLENSFQKYQLVRLDKLNRLSNWCLTI